MEKYDVDLICKEIDKQLISQGGFEDIVISLELFPNFICGLIVFSYQTVGWKNISYKSNESHSIFTFKK